MAYTVDWVAKIITIPTSDLTLISGTRYRLSMEAFHIEIRRLEAEFADGLWAPLILDHTNSKPDFAGANYVAFDEVINGYTIQFTGVATRVDVTDTNNNIVDTLIVTGVSVVPSNSAGLVNLNEIRGTAFMGDEGFGVTCDALNVSGKAVDSIVYPSGTRTQPVLTETNFHSLLGIRGFLYIYFMSNMTINGDHSIGHTFYGDNQGININLGAGCNVSGCTFKNAHMTGKYSTGNITERSVIGNVTNANRYFDTCAFYGTVVFSEDTKIENCSIATGAVNQETIFDFNNLAIEVVVGGWTAGRIRCINMVPGSFLGVSGTGGRVIIDNVAGDSITGGTVVYAGSMAVDDTHAANLTELKDSTVAGAVWTKADGQFLVKVVKNYKEVKKIAASWYLIIYDDGEVSGGVEVLRKKLTDSTGADITDLAAGTLAKELENSVI